MCRTKYKDDLCSTFIYFKVKLSPIFKYIKLLSTFLVLSVISYYAWHSKNILITTFYAANFSLLLTTALLLVSINFILPVGSIMLLKSYSVSLSYHNALKAHIHYLPARYLPGGIWQSVGKMVDYHSHGIALSHLALFVLLENFITVSGAFILGGGCVGYFRGLHDNWGRLASVAVIMSLSSLIIVAYIMSRYTSKQLKCIFSFSFFLKSIAIYILVFLIFGLIFSLYILSFSLTMNKIYPVEIGGTYLFSWAIGFVSVFTPQGLGITEFMAGKLLPLNMSNSSLTVLVAGFRVVRLISDLCTWIGYRIFLIVFKKNPSCRNRDIIISTDV